MEHRRIGKSAIYVSDICMGTMTFGSQTDEAEAHRILDKCGHPRTSQRATSIAWPAHIARRHRRGHCYFRLDGKERRLVGLAYAATYPFNTV